MKAEREMTIKLTLLEEEAHLMITGLNYGTMHVKDHIKTKEADDIIKRLHTLESIVRESVYGGS